jgi:hypothetical protein
MLAPLDDVVVRIDSVELYGKVSEGSVTDDGAHLVTVVYNMAAGDALDDVIERGRQPFKRSD